MHLADRIHLPNGYRARPYRGADDHVDMVRTLVAYREHVGDPEYPTVEQLDATYAHLIDCDPDLDIFVVEFDDRVVGYGRTSRSEDEDGTTNCIMFAPIASRPSGSTDVRRHRRRGRRPTCASWLDVVLRRASGLRRPPRPGPSADRRGRVARGSRLRGRRVGRVPLVRPHLDDIPDIALPEGSMSDPYVPTRCA